MAVKDKTDKSILDLLKSPDSRDKAFSLLLDRYSERLYWHIRHMVLIHDDADDVLQNTWMKVHRNIDNFNEKSELFTWLYRIATNESINLINQKKRRYASAEMYKDEIKVALHADPYFEGDEIELHLQAAIAELTDKQREVFILKYYDAKSYKEISELTGISVGGLKAQYHHATKKIESVIRHKTFTI
jgi:RNA polymerase sigma-70 factor (ECF subfamily)